ncbi:hypothetical protein A0H81_02112 [Grifola frondosa]|uniref:Uncharacterized protein n=1 Tax=Grifola frondosa TaxID=5627 RepID=A0A1C7MM67_GRIFR|nr:hypothetical protein A0H81_02112 [Grifola frondosa]
MLPCETQQDTLQLSRNPTQSTQSTGKSSFMWHVRHSIQNSRVHRDYVRLDGNGSAVHAMNHEHPANTPRILQRAADQQDVKMVGVEGLLAGNLDRLVNELEGDAFEARISS